MANIRFFLDMIKKLFFDNVFYGRGTQYFLRGGVIGVGL